VLASIDAEGWLRTALTAIMFVIFLTWHTYSWFSFSVGLHGVVACSLFRRLSLGQINDTRGLTPAMRSWGLLYGFIFIACGCASIKLLNYYW
jgi:hypothetical protein